MQKLTNWYRNQKNPCSILKSCTVVYLHCAAYLDSSPTTIYKVIQPIKTVLLLCCKLLLIEDQPGQKQNNRPQRFEGVFCCILEQFRLVTAQTGTARTVNSIYCTE